MLEFWCVVIFGVLGLTTLWLVEALDRMMKEES